MEFLSFKKFNDKESAKELVRVLHDNGIRSEMVFDGSNLDTLYVGGELSNFYHVKIAGHDFTPARTILLNHMEAQVMNAGADHYLFSFSDEELLEVIYKADEWSEFDFLLAKRILGERGKIIDEYKTDLLERNRKLELAVPEEMEISLSYSKSMLGIFGAMMAWSVITHKKTLPDGQRVYLYPGKRANRRNGSFSFHCCFFL